MEMEDDIISINSVIARTQHGSSALLMWFTDGRLQLDDLLSNGTYPVRSKTNDFCFRWVAVWLSEYRTWSYWIESCSRSVCVPGRYSSREHFSSTIGGGGGPIWLN